MIKLYRGAGPSEYTSVEIKAFTKKVTGLDDNTFRYLDSTRFCLNSRLNSSFVEEYNFELDDFLIGYKSMAYWKSDDVDNGCIAVSIPSKERDIDEVTELLPEIANTFTQDMFSELGIENPRDYSIESVDLESIPQIDSIEGELEEFAIDMVCFTVTHDELNATLKWYASATEDFINAYGCVYNESDPEIFQNSAILSSLLVPKERRLDTGLDIDLQIVGGLDWDILNQDVIQTFTAPDFGNDTLLRLDTNSETEKDGTIILSESTQFTLPEGIVQVKVGQKPHHTVAKPDDSWVPVESNFSNRWDDTFYYQKDEDVEKLKGRLERSENIFLYFETTTELGFVGNDNYYRLINTLNDIKPSNKSVSTVLFNTVLQ